MDTMKITYVNKRGEILTLVYKYRYVRYDASNLSTSEFLDIEIQRQMNERKLK